MGEAGCKGGGEGGAQAMTAGGLGAMACRVGKGSDDLFVFAEAGSCRVRLFE